MSGADEGRDAAGFCAELVRNQDFARYASTLFVPAAQRRALLAMYAFNVEISRVREHVTQPLPGEMRLQWWTDTLAGAGHGGIEGNPVAAELLLAIRSGLLPVERLSRLIDEHQFDLYNDPMPTMAALEGYIHDTSSALFSLGAGISGWQSDEIEHLAASIVRAAATASTTRLRDGRGVRGYRDAETSCGAESVDWRSAGTSDDGLRIAAERAAGRKTGFSAAGAGQPRSGTDVACGQQSVHAPCYIAASNLVDVVAGVAVARI